MGVLDLVDRPALHVYLVERVEDALRLGGIVGSLDPHEEGLAVLERERRRAEDALGRRRLEVGSDVGEERRVGGVGAELVEVEPGILHHGLDLIGLAEVEPRGVALLQEPEQKVAKGVVPLPPRRLERAEGGQAPAGVVVCVVPQPPLRALLAVLLFQREGAPVDLQRVALSLFDLSQPNCCLVDVGSHAVEIDVDADALVHSVLPWFLF